MIFSPESFIEGMKGGVLLSNYHTCARGGDNAHFNSVLFASRPTFSYSSFSLNILQAIPDDFILEEFIFT